MFDEMERLRETQKLFDLLSQYAVQGMVDRQAWQDRLMEMEDVSTSELSRLHGELIAYNWIEQNTGVTPILKEGGAACCYRVTSAGLRTYREICEERELVTGH